MINFVYFNLHDFKQDMGIRKILNGMAESIPRIQYALRFVIHSDWY